MLDRLLGGSEPDDGGDCGCDATCDGDRLHLAAADCPGQGDLARSEACRATAVRRLAGRSVETVRTTTAGFERVYRDDAVDLLTAAGRFADAAAFHDERVATLAARDPVAAASEAAGRAGPIGRLGETTGLVAAAEAVPADDPAVRAFTGPTVRRWLVDPTLPESATLQRATELDTGGTARLYLDETGRRRYHLDPLAADLAQGALATLDRAHEHLAAGAAGDGEAAPGRAVRAVATPGDPVETLARVLRKHTRGPGILGDLFADPAVSDVFVTAPATANPLHVTVDGAAAATNVRPTRRGVGALASRFRRESGRAFSRASPVLDATATLADRRVRVAGVTDPASTGEAFAFRAHDRRAWTVPDLVANGTLRPTAAGLLSVAARRGAALLLAGPRGAGKTTLLGAMLWELPRLVRTVVIEDAPELPVDTLQSHGRDVQALRAGHGDTDLSPERALRTALRLGDGALVVGEVRGAEAGVLYEAMRVGANSEAVLGTIHGSDAASVRDRVVEDLGVAPASFGATDLVVSLTYDETADRARRVGRVEEVGDDGHDFAELLARRDGELRRTGRMDRGNSELLAALARPSETYADVLAAVDARADHLATLAGTDESGPGALAAAGDNRP